MRMERIKTHWPTTRATLGEGTSLPATSLDDAVGSIDVELTDDEIVQLVPAAMTTRASLTTQNSTGCSARIGDSSGRVCPCRCASRELRPVHERRSSPSRVFEALRSDVDGHINRRCAASSAATSPPRSATVTVSAE
jgi:hypothetical protein